MNVAPEGASEHALYTHTSELHSGLGGEALQGWLQGVSPLPPQGGSRVSMRQDCGGGKGLSFRQV